MPNIDEHIRKAMQDGQFSDLPGKGKPLQMEDNPFADPDWRLAHHMLKSSGFTLPWIEKRQEIFAQLEAARSALTDSWQRRKHALSEGQPFDRVEQEWRRALESFTAQIQALNKAIQIYNLETPSVNFQLPPINLDREINAVTDPETPRLSQET